MMRIILAIVFLGLLIKDTSGLGDRYVLRGFGQILALFAGMWWFLSIQEHVEFRKYLFLILYFFAIGISVFFSHDLLYSGLQVLSLGSLFLFFIAYHQALSDEKERDNVLVKTVTMSAIILFAGSLLAIKIWPSVAYLYMEIERTWRFRGLFGMPATMGANAGLMSGLILLSDERWVIKLPIGLLALACLILTGSRTLWLAWLAAILFVTWWIHRNARLKLIFISIFCVILLVLTWQAIGTKKYEKDAGKAVRIESARTFSGRMMVWERGLREFKKRPLFGYGFATGDDAFRRQYTQYAEGSNPRKKTRYTLHNGYLQALLDSGLIGAILYLVILIKAFLNLVRTHERRYSWALFVVIFTAFANVGESVMFAAAEPHSVLAWFYLVYGLSLSKQSRKLTEKSGSFVGKSFAQDPTC